MSRKTFFERKTSETRISVDLDIDGRGSAEIQTPVGFFNHMLETFVRHGLFDLKMEAGGDTHVDQHHLVEDCGLVLGKAFNEALGDRKGVNRAGYFVYPMDEALAVVAVDLGGRAFLQYDVSFKRQFCGDLDTDLFEELYGGRVE